MFTKQYLPSLSVKEKNASNNRLINIFLNFICTRNSIYISQCTTFISNM